MRRVALCVGVDRYEDDEINNLSCAANDAAVTAFMLRQCGFDDAKHMPGTASPDEVMALLHTLGQPLKRGDVFVFFFAGHGKTLANAPGQADQLFLLHKAQQAMLGSGVFIGAPGLLSLRALKAASSRWQGVHTLFIFDACRSPLSRAEVAFRDTQVRARFEGAGVFRDVLLLAERPAAAGAKAHHTIINSCSEGQQAEELPRYPHGGHGLLTAAFTEELSAVAAAGQALATDAAFAQRLHGRMQALAQRYGTGQGQQQPMLVGPPVTLLQARSDAAEQQRHAAEWDQRLWRLTQAESLTRGIDAYKDYLSQAQQPAAFVDEALRRIEDWHRQHAQAQQEAAQVTAERAKSEQAARARQEQDRRRAEYFRPGRRFKEAPYAPEMVVIPAGRFVMGSPKPEPERWGDEGPQHEVKIARRFAMGRCVVTFDEYDVFAEEAGRALPDDRGWGRKGMPAINVSWLDAQAYVQWLNGKLGLSGAEARYRLPTEAEWEYAARAGTQTAFWWGPYIDTSKANYDGNHAYAGGTRGEYRQRTVKADAFEPNVWGLYQVHGNVKEWVQDAWHDSYKGAPADGSEWLAGADESRRVLRGGSWDVGPRGLRAAYRGGNSPDFRDIITGFRIARTL